MGILNRIKNKTATTNQISNSSIGIRDFLAVPFWAIAIVFDWLAVKVGGRWTAEMYVGQQALTQPTTPLTNDKTIAYV